MTITFRRDVILYGIIAAAAVLLGAWYFSLDQRFNREIDRQIAASTDPELVSALRSMRSSQHMSAQRKAFYIEAAEETRKAADTVRQMELEYEKAIREGKVEAPAK